MPRAALGGVVLLLRWGMVLRGGTGTITAAMEVRAVAQLSGYAFLGTITAAMEVRAVARLSGYAFLRSFASVNEPHAN